MLELGLILSTVLSSELALRLPFVRTLKTLAATLKKSGDVLFSRNISDAWKEKILSVYALRIFLNSLLLPLLLVMVFAPIFLVTRLMSPTTFVALGVLTSTYNLLLITISSVFYLIIRVRFLNARLFKA
ncbi:MAG: hypothetical protein BECKG1743D_GA0114223_112411 [Candidatus Kentron sp. G]|nr:MAG: hypothetical protein BECKG1743F_GA0114225_111871 [Candidatus Kentron sp. G]VFN07554.1 MAG: hypothetical protein BECKG1743E_GA0114224_112391 [Candidatus Kentron sp. G]VFN08019.1 MAG: hypothetical protein BECKG1743D_GA0114223_112411 [Candidatus Kentron sp. G]